MWQHKISSKLLNFTDCHINHSQIILQHVGSCDDITSYIQCTLQARIDCLASSQSIGLCSYHYSLYPPNKQKYPPGESILAITMYM